MRRRSARLWEIFDEVGGFEKKDWPEGPALSWTTPGIFLVVTDMHHAPSHATAIQKCFWQSGRKVFKHIALPSAMRARILRTAA
jgi:hypothetical protein